MEETAAPSHAASPLAHRDFRLMWGGLFVSQIGTQMQLAALAWHVYQLTHNALWLGAIGLVRVVPMICTALIGGVIADSVDRRRLLLRTQALLAASSTVLAVTTFTGHITLPLLYAATAINGVLVALDTPARQALLPSLVPPEALSRALSLNVSTFQVATVVGPSLGGLMLAAAGPGGVYFADALSYTAVLAALWHMDYRPARLPTVRPSFAAVQAGLDFVRRTPLLWSTMWLDFFAMFFGGCTLLLPIFAQELLHIGPLGYGFLMAGPGIGATLMATFIAVRGLPARQGRCILWAVAVYGLALTIFGLSQSFPLALCMLALSGAADTLSTVVRQTLRMMVTPEDMRGRMSSINMIFFAGGPQLGEAEAGVVARLGGARLAVAVGGVACMGLAAAYTWFDKRLRNYTVPT